MYDWLEALKSCHDNHISCVLVTIIDSEGSMPRGVGTKMLVTETDLVGSIGGSRLEFEATRFARGLLVGSETATTHFFADHGDDNNHYNSKVTLLFEPFRANDFNIVLFGAGHVGRALIHVLAALTCRITWVDDRAGIFPDHLPATVHPLLNETPEAEVEKARSGSFFLLMSHSHEQDYRIGEAILKRNDFRYFGMIGSAHKRQQFERRVLDLGISQDTLNERLICPMGLDGITGRQPAEIAIAIAAQILLVWNKTQTDKIPVHHSDKAT
jgi:xanthine dehydrogenase accessory factor